MVDYFYRPQPAIDAEGLRIADEGSGSVYAITDATFSTPLSVTLSSGATSTVVSVSSLGQVEAFTVADHAEVNFKSGDFVSPIVAWSSVVADALASRQAAESAAIAAQASATATATAVNEIAALRSWFEQGLTIYNLVPNPSFEVDLSGVSSSSDLATVRTTGFFAVGAASMTCTVSATPSTSYTFVYQSLGAVAPGEFVAGKARVRSSGGSYRYRVRFIYFDATGANLGISAWQSYVTGANATWVDVEGWATAGAPAGTASANMYLYIHNTSADTAPANAVFATDAWIAAKASTMALARARIATYFDGSFAPTNSVGYGWLGIAHSSPSKKVDMTQFVSQAIPAGGTGGQVLTKSSDADFAYAWTTPTGGAGTDDHGLLAGLGDDDHPQYLTQSRGDTRYYTKAQVDSIANAAASAQSNVDRNRNNHYGVQPLSSLDTTGTPSSSTFLRGDGLWAVPAGGGGGGGGAVDSVNGQTGTVVLDADDVGLGGFAGLTPSSLPLSIAATSGLNGKADVSHSHTTAQIAGLDALIDTLITSADVDEIKLLTVAAYNALPTPRPARILYLKKG